MAYSPEAALRRGLAALALLLAALTPAEAAVAPGQPVVLLHGLARSSDSMEPMAQALRREGYAVCNIDYPSRDYPVAVLAHEHVAPQIARCFPERTQPLHFVTHSMGGILVRELAASGDAGAIGRVVMLGPPNHGSEVVDRFGRWEVFRRIGGPAGAELGTGPASAGARLGDASFELGVITGRRSWNWMLSLMIPGEDDGKVAIASAALPGMRDFLVLDTSHPFVMRDAQAMRQTLIFLREGRFRRAPAAPPQALRAAFGRAGAAPRKAEISSSQ